MIAFRERARRRLPLGMRDLYGLNANHRMRLRTASENIKALVELLDVVQEDEAMEVEAPTIVEELIKEFTAVLEILVVDVPQVQLRARSPRQTFDLMKNELLRLGIDCSTRFRYQSLEKLTRLVVGF